MKSKGLRRAFKTNDAARLVEDIPLITDTTELITPEIAEKMLQKNKTNRPINWNKVEQYRKMMEAGEWKLHSQGIIFDDKGNLLTGQKRLWAIIYSGEQQYFRVSRGTPRDRAYLIDRGTPQSSRDLAARATDRKHSPTEASICRAMFAIEGNIKPTLDEIAASLVSYDAVLDTAMKQTKGIKKTKSVMMIMAAICHTVKNDPDHSIKLFSKVSEWADKLESELAPIEINKCWNRGAAFTLAMEKAVNICKNGIK